MSVVKKGLKAIVKHFEEFRTETRNCTKIKLMVVGQENVGKSIPYKYNNNNNQTKETMALLKPTIIIIK